MHCASAKCQSCSKEAGFSGFQSPGPVVDSERVCRIGYSPSHGKKNQGPSKSIVRATDLHAGELSVWRISRKLEFGVPEVIDIADQTGPSGGDVWKLFAPCVERIRKLSLKTGGFRSFCVLDDTDCGAPQNHHPMHATIAPCQDFEFLKLSVDQAEEDGEFQQLRRDLTLLLKENEIWSRLPPSGQTFAVQRSDAAAGP